jgi:hypothetical protein
MHQRSCTILDDIAYVDAFGDTLMEFNGEHATDMGLLYVVRTGGSYSQLSPVMHFLQNFLTWSVVILMLLPVGAAKVVTDILFVVSSYGVPVCYQQDIQEHVAAECKSPWHAAECGGCCNSNGVHYSRQCLVDNVSGLCHILRWIAVE